MPRWVRHCLTVACVLAAWLVVRPADAAAPVCDSRGASAVAPAPFLDAPSSSIDVDTNERCETLASANQVYHRGHRPEPQAPPDHNEAVLAPSSESSTLFAPAHIRLMPDGFHLPSGVLAELDRPPRV